MFGKILSSLFPSHFFRNNLQLPLVTLSEEREPDYFQEFCSLDDAELATLPTHVCPETGKRYLFRNDIQKALEGIAYLQLYWVEIILFMMMIA